MERRDSDIELARRVHYGFLPQVFSNDTLDIAVAVLPHEDLGGDYCSIFPVADERVVVCLCDAVGHGLASALFAARVNTYVLTHARESPHPCALIESLNEFV
ncbi:MAG: SpoIIE family protein phosphatase [Thermoanaerobaculia bacterium]